MQSNHATKEKWCICVSTNHLRVLITAYQISTNVIQFQQNIKQLKETCLSLRSVMNDDRGCSGGEYDPNWESATFNL